MSDKAKERYWSYRRGWKDGVVGTVPRSKFTGHRRDDLSTAYVTGYTAGKKALNVAMKEAQDRLGHTPSIRRASAYAADDRTED